MTCRTMSLSLIRTQASAGVPFNLSADRVDGGHRRRARHDVVCGIVLVTRFGCNDHKTSVASHTEPFGRRSFSSDPLLSPSVVALRKTRATISNTSTLWPALHPHPTPPPASCLSAHAHAEAAGGSGNYAPESRSAHTCLTRAIPPRICLGVTAFNVTRATDAWGRLAIGPSADAFASLLMFAARCASPGIIAAFMASRKTARSR